jgi:hypothetical protein
MTKDKELMQNVRLKNGQNAGYIKQQDGGVFLVLRTLSNPVIYLLTLILLMSIILAIITVQFVADGFNQIIMGMKIMDARIGLLLHNQTALLIPNNETT